MFVLLDGSITVAPPSRPSTPGTYYTVFQESMTFVFLITQSKMTVLAVFILFHFRCNKH